MLHNLKGFCSLVKYSNETNLNVYKLMLFYIYFKKYSLKKSNILVNYYSLTIKWEHYWILYIIVIPKRNIKTLFLKDLKRIEIAQKRIIMNSPYLIIVTYANCRFKKISLFIYVID